MRYIGDVHGNMYHYKRIIEGCSKSVQVGDFGIGYRDIIDKSFVDSIPNPDYVHHNFSMDHRFIRGNHDNPEVCKLCNNWIPDGTVEGNTMFIGGASSIDKKIKRSQFPWWPDTTLDAAKVKKLQEQYGNSVVFEGFNWWADEEISYTSFEKIFEKYSKTRPEIVVSHECPDMLVEYLKPYAYKEKSATRMAFDTLFEIHRPQLWIFGHWHVDFDSKVRDTRFICLNINQYVDFPD